MGPQVTAQADQASTNWRQFRRGTVVPILLLVALLALLGYTHIDLASGYTAPRVVADEEDALVFYDAGARDHGFFMRRSSDGKEFGKRVWVPGGTLAAATLNGDQLVTLYAGKKEKKRTWFYSLYTRKTLERVWSGVFEDPNLELTYPRHVATLGGEVYAFGTNTKGALRVVRIPKRDPDFPDVDEAGSRQPKALNPPPELAGAAVLEPKEGDGEKRDLDKVEPPVLFASATDGATLLLFWRVTREKGAKSPGEVRWTTFDGRSFGSMRTLSRDLSAMTLGPAPDAAAGGPPGSRLRLFGVLHGVKDSDIRIYSFKGDGFEQTGTIAYEREGLTGGAGVVALSSGVCGGREYLFAQIGASIRYTSREPAKEWGPWEDFARRPAEQTAVIYGWFGSMMFICALLVFQGIVVFRLRRQAQKQRRARLPAPAPTPLTSSAEPPPTAPPPAVPPTSPAPAPAATTAVARTVEASPPALDDVHGEKATILERCVAFLIDFVFVVILCSAGAYFVPDLLERAQHEGQLAQLVLLTWFMVLLLGYFILFESLFARTPGKRLMGLEVQDVDGGQASVSAMVYRNLFRVELLVPPPYIVPLLSLLVMIVNQHHQRPGDLVARTAVRRTLEEGTLLAVGE